MRRIHLEQELIQEIMLTSDADREAFDQQWQREEAARQKVDDARVVERFKAKREAKANPPPRPTRYLCANCQLPHDWAEPPEDKQWFRCHRCHQLQTVEQARKQLLQMYRGY